MRKLQLEPQLLLGLRNAEGEKKIWGEMHGTCLGRLDRPVCACSPTQIMAQPTLQPQTRATGISKMGGDAKSRQHQGEICYIFSRSIGHVKCTQGLLLGNQHGHPDVPAWALDPNLPHSDIVALPTAQDSINVYSSSACPAVSASDEAVNPQDEALMSR